MHMTPDNQWIDDIRRRIQTALNESKRDTLREQYGMVDEYHSPDMPPEMEGQWLDYITEFERQFENAPRITVRARIGDPALPPIDTLNDDELVEVVDTLMELLEAQQIAVDFLGDVTYETVYRYLTEELLDYEMDDIRIPDTWIRFIYATDEYNATESVEEFVEAIFRHDLENVLNHVDDKELWTDSSGRLATVADLEALWARLPVSKGIAFEALETQITGDEGQLRGRVTWAAEGENHSIEVSFEVYRSRYLDEAWGVGRTSLIEGLWGVYG